MNSDTLGLRPALALLDRLKRELPETGDKGRIVGKWVWLEFNVPPVLDVRNKLKKLGFFWNGRRKCWQNPCTDSSENFRESPEQLGLAPSDTLKLQEQQTARTQALTCNEFKVVSLRECPLPENMTTCETPQNVADYWRINIETNPYFNPECECLSVLLLNTRRKVKGHQLITLGTLDTLLVHPREVFRGAVVAAASAIVIAHNHPSGESQPSEADIKVTRDLIRAGKLMKIEVLDHVVIGKSNHCSLRELGYFP